MCKYYYCGWSCFLEVKPFISKFLFAKSCNIIKGIKIKHTYEYIICSIYYVYIEYIANTAYNIHN